MRAALSDDHALNGGSTMVTWFARSLVDLKVVLKITAAVNPVNAGTIAADAFF